MRTFLVLVLASALGLAYAGVGTLSPSEEANALTLFNRLCNGYSGGGKGQDIGGNRIYCKRAPGEVTESRNHRVNVPGSAGSGQTVFIQPPPARYHHNVEIVSGGALGDQTKIYVLPQQTTHTITPRVQQTPGTQNKPTVYFLKGGSSSGGSSNSNNGPGSNYGPPRPVQVSYGAPQQQQQPTQPSYGPPPPSQPVQVQPNYGVPQTRPIQVGFGSPAVIQPVNAGYESHPVNVHVGVYGPPATVGGY